jgi:hypothetical protein
MEEEDVNWDYSEDGDALAICLEIGDNFAINVVVDKIMRAKNFGL